MGDGGGGAESIREREAKLGAGVGLDLEAVDLSSADLPDEAAGLAVGPAERSELDAWYLDTADLRLARRGITLRLRRSHRSLAPRGADGPATWTLKLPAAAAAGALVRDELSVDDLSPGPPDGAPPPADAVPAVLAGLVLGTTRRARLVPVARLVTRRAVHPLVTPDGRRWGEVDDDEVTVSLPTGTGAGDDLPPSAESARFRELEVELAEDAPAGLLPPVVAALQAAGAGPAEPTPKLVRALGPRAAGPPSPAEPVLGRRPTLGEVVRAGLARSVAGLVAHDLGVRLDGDVEAVHQARVATRRLRSDLRTFRGVLEPGWVDPLRDELKWLGQELGRVRDADVLLRRLEAAVADLGPEDRDGGDALVDRLRRERARHLDRLLARLASPRYLRLLDRLVEAAEGPPLAASAGRKADKVLPVFVHRPWKRLRRDADRLAKASAAPSDGELHELRKRAKRARYAVDVAAPVVGGPARKLYSALGHLQDELGELQDAVVAEAWLRRAATSRSQALVAGLLIADLRRQREDHRAAWPARWKDARRSRLTSWIP